MESSSHRKGNNWIFPLALATAALAVRLWHIASLRALPLFEHPYEGLDAELYINLARVVAAGDLFPPGLLHAAPVYAHFLGALFRVAGDGLLLPRIVQAVLGSITVLILWRTGREIAGARAGAVAGIVAALYSPFILSEGTLQSAALVPFLTSFLILMLIRARSSGRWALAAGFLFAATVLNRPDTLLLLAPVPVWLLLAGEGRRPAALFLAAALVILVPYSMRSSERAGGFTPVSAHGGIHFYIGNHEGADGTLSPVEGVRPTPEGFARDTHALAIKESGRTLTAAQVSSHWFARGLDWIRSDPVAWMRLLARKTLLFWNDYEIPNNEDLYFLRRFSLPLNLPVPLFGLVAPFAIFGILFGRFSKGSRSLLTIVTIVCFLSALLFFVTGRYRLPAAPPLILLASGGIMAALSAARKRQAMFLLLIPLFVFCNLPVRRFDFAAPECRLGSSYIQRGDWAEAEAAFSRAETIHSGFAEAKRGLARVYRETERSEQAIRIYGELAALDRESRTARNDMATLLAREGRTDEAIRILEELLSEERMDVVVLGNLAACRIDTDEDSLATALLEEALAIDPEYAGALLNLALIHARHGRYPEALELFGRHLAIEPFSERALYNAGITHAMTGDLRGALRLWERLEILDPSYPRLQEQIGRAREMTGG